MSGVGFGDGVGCRVQGVGCVVQGVGRRFRPVETHGFSRASSASLGGIIRKVRVTPFNNYGW